MEEQLSGQISLFPEDTTGYDKFTAKFKPKKTTDDCYTPELIYDAVADWVAQEYGLDRANFVRPFYPGGDYEHYGYSPESVVVDNPPFSILSKIVNFYMKHGIRFFIFAPTLTLLRRRLDVCHLAIGAEVTYENGAVVNTSFITNMDHYVLRCVPELYKAIDEANRKNLRAMRKELPKYTYPDAVVTTANIYGLSKYGVPFNVRPEDAAFISTLDHMKQVKGRDAGIFGSALLISERAAAERAAAERAAAERAARFRWQLSEREQGIQRKLGKD